MFLRTLVYSLLLSASAQSAERQLIFLGGGGEPINESKTIFDDALKGISSYVANNNWSHIVSFNGGHSETENIMRTSFPKAMNRLPFNEVNYNAIIDHYITQMETGKIGKDDQVMMMINTHGASASESEKTHSIAIGKAPTKLELEKLGNTKTINMDRLARLSELAKQKGVKLAILDFSCHSGASLSLANENTCVLSASSPNHFAYSDFASQFIEQMKAGKTLEDVFLDTRRNTTSTSFPMISTPEGLSINKEIYPGIAPFLFFNSEQDIRKSNKLADYLLETSKSVCNCGNQFDPLIKRIEELAAANKFSSYQSLSELNDLKKYLLEYKAKQDGYRNFLKDKEAEMNFGKSEHFEQEYDYNKRKLSLKSDKTIGELLKTNFSLIDSNLALQLRDTKEPGKRAEILAAMRLSTKERLYTEDYLKKNPEAKTYKETFAKNLALRDDTYEIANKVAVKEKALYDTVYKSIKKSDVKNPCRDFRL